MSSEVDRESFVRRWETAAPMLEEVARRELRELSDDERRLAIESLFKLSESFAVSESTPETCGLVEQQRLFGLLPR